MSVPVSPKFPTILRDLVDKSKRVPDIDLSNVGDDFTVNEVIPEEIILPNIDTDEFIISYGYEIKSNCYNKLLSPHQANDLVDVVIYTHPKNIINDDGEFCLITIPEFSLGFVSMESFNLGGVLNKNNNDIEGYPFRYKFMVNDYMGGNITGCGYLYFSEDPTIGEERIIEEFIDYGEIKETISKQPCILKFDARYGNNIINETVNVNIEDYNYISYIKTENIYNITEFHFENGAIPVYNNRIMFEFIYEGNIFLISPYCKDVLHIKYPDIDNGYTSIGGTTLFVINKIFDNQYIKIDNVFQTILELPANTNSCTITTQLYWNNDTPPELEGNNITISIFDNKASFHKSSYE